MLFSKNSRSKHKDISKIISVDPYNSIFYKYQNSKIDKIEKLDFNKKNLIASTLNTKDFITTVINLSIHIPHEDLKDAIELKTYEELELDQAVAYIIRYEEIKDRRTDKDRFFNVFITEPENIKEIFKSVKDRVKYIDAIYPKPYLIKNIYEKNIIEPFGVHGFLYFQIEDAFVALFKDGQYLYSKSIKYSFEVIYEHFCELYGEKVDKDKFFETLQEDDINSNDTIYFNHLNELFSEIALHINNILLYAKRAFNIETINLFFTGTYFGKLNGLDEYIKRYLDLDSSNFDFDYGIDSSDNRYIDQFHYLTIIEASKGLDDSSVPNFTIFLRPPPFALRKSGKFLIALSATTLLALFIPAYNYIYDSYIKIDIKLLQNETEKIIKLSNSIRNEIKKLKTEKKKISTSLETEKSILEKKKKILQNIYDKKVNYLMKAKRVVQLGNDMSKFGVHVIKIVNKENLFILSLYARSEKNITEFVKYLTNRYSKTLHIEIEKIFKDEKNGTYRGDLKVKVL